MKSTKMEIKKNNVKNIIIVSAIIVVLFLLPMNVHAQARNLTVKIYTPLDFNNIWLGTSTGGYDLIAEQGTDYVFEIFVKNGMNNMSLHNVYMTPKDFPFEVKSITPKKFEELKPMEIKRYWVHIFVPSNSTEGKYPINFDIGSDEFPPGIFILENEIKVVRKIRTGVYITYAAISIILIAILIYRKIKIRKQATKMKYE